VYLCHSIPYRTVKGGFIVGIFVGITKNKYFFILTYQFVMDVIRFRPDTIKIKGLCKLQSSFFMSEILRVALLAPFQKNTRNNCQQYRHKKPVLPGYLP
jgi:hypothetical protein